MKKIAVLALASTMVMASGVAFAGIDNTHHDTSTNGISVGTGDQKCNYCHSITGLTAQAGLGSVGAFCVVACHLQGTAADTKVTNNAEPKSPGVFNWAAGVFSMVTTNNEGPIILSGGHGMDKGVGFLAAAGEAASVTATGWPHTAGNSLQCTSCHAVHDAANPPFLNAKLSNNTQSGGFCQRCHTNTGRQQAWASVGNHPIEFAWSTSAANARDTNNETKVSGAGTVNLGNRELTVGAGITNVNVDTSIATATDLTTDLATHWNLGGHLINTTSGMPDTAGNFGCYSCHTVHAGVTSSNSLANIFVVGDSIQTVCFGCHTTEPGRTNYGHPIGPAGVDDPIGSGVNNAWTIPLTAAYTASEFDVAAGNAPLCVTCHDVHGATANYMALRTIQAIPANGSACEMCHASSFTMGTGVDQHHPGTAPKNYVADLGYAASAGWLTVDNLGDLSDGLSCPDCHVGDGNATKRSSAHNWAP